MRSPAVLIVDDDFLVRINTADILQDAGFEVVEARDAVSALASLQECPRVQLVCADVQMQGEFDGTDLARRVLDQHPGIAVITMSAHTQHRGRVPDAPFLCKPIPARRLVELAGEVLAAAPPRTVRAAPHRLPRRGSSSPAARRNGEAAAKVAAGLAGDRQSQEIKNS